MKFREISISLIGVYYNQAEEREFHHSLKPLALLSFLAALWGSFLKGALFEGGCFLNLEGGCFLEESEKCSCQ